MAVKISDQTDQRFTDPSPFNSAFSLCGPVGLIRYTEGEVGAQLKCKVWSVNADLKSIVLVTWEGVKRLWKVVITIRQGEPVGFCFQALEMIWKIGDMINGRITYYRYDNSYKDILHEYRIPCSVSTPWRLWTNWKFRWLYQTWEYVVRCNCVSYGSEVQHYMHLNLR